MSLTKEEVEMYRRENTIIMEPPIPDWATEENRVLNELCDSYLLMNWLDVGNRFVMRRGQDKIRSDHCVEMAVGFYIRGRYTIVEGNTVREAIMNAIAMGAE